MPDRIINRLFCRLHNIMISPKDGNGVEGGTYERMENTISQKYFISGQRIL